ncbi:uncharacterized protein LOC143776558 isoform X1 [Ranitomeya variabilis]|uniref:uncharacterized protein LOC143776558 isoform X1 n=1 Tax=Ranitomeya variabilis TaxID=490064 RepID=UPI004055A561
MAKITQNDTTITMWFDPSKHLADFRFDLCKVVDCQWNLKFGRKSSNPIYRFLTGVEGAVVYICVTRPGNENCNSWSDATWNTGTSWGYKPEEAMNRVSLSGKPLLERIKINIVLPNWNCEPEVHTWGLSFNPLFLTLNEPSLGDEGLYVLGLYIPGRQGQLGTFWLKALPQQKEENPQEIVTESPMEETKFKIPEDRSYEEKIAIETGYAERIEWLMWMKYTAEQNNKTNCIACATARPHLGTIPLRISDPDQTDLKCILALYNTSYDPTDNALCYALSALHPPVTTDQLPPRIFAYPGNYTCFQRIGTGGVEGGRESNFRIL